LLIWFLGGVTHRKKETRQTAYLLVNTTHEGYAAKADAGHGKPKSAPQEVIHKMKPWLLMTSPLLIVIQISWIHQPTNLETLSIITRPTNRCLPAIIDNIRVWTVQR